MKILFFYNISVSDYFLLDDNVILASYFKMDESRKQTSSKWIYHGIYIIWVVNVIWFMNLCEFAPNNCLHPLCKDPYQFTTEADF